MTTTNTQAPAATEAPSDEPFDSGWESSTGTSLNPNHRAPKFDPLSAEVSALRWLLNITTEFDRKDVRTRQAARLLDDYSCDGRTNREHLESLWSKLATPAPAVGAKEPWFESELIHASNAGYAQGLIDGKALAAVGASVQPSDWLLIDGAPKDGTEILLGRAANEELDQYAISVPGYWQKGYEDGVDYMGADDGFVDSHHQVFSGGRSFGSVSHRYAPNQPTHWMPLPAPPAALHAGAGEKTS